MAANLQNLPRHYYTLEEYFALEKGSDARYEYWEGEIVCMSGGTKWHYSISDNVHLALSRLLAGRDCRAFTGGAPIYTPSLPPYRYPDASVVCGRPSFRNINGIDVLTNPILIVEVLSPGTEQLDKEPKRDAHLKIASVKDYLVVAQDAPHVTQYQRPGRRRTRSDYGDLKAIVELNSIRVGLPMSDIYRDVSFSPLPEL